MYLQSPAQILQTVGEVWTFQINHYTTALQQNAGVIAEATRTVSSLRNQLTALQRDAQQVSCCVIL